MARALVLHAKDNVATLIDPGSKGQTVTFSGERRGALSLVADIPYGHKFMIEAAQIGDEIVKYGQVIGRATKCINVGDHAHIHNVEALRGRGDLEESQ